LIAFYIMPKKTGLPIFKIMPQQSGSYDSTSATQLF
jgi:hypothetical protein